MSAADMSTANMSTANMSTSTRLRPLLAARSVDDVILRDVHRNHYIRLGHTDWVEWRDGDTDYREYYSVAAQPVTAFFCDIDGSCDGDSCDASWRPMIQSLLLSTLELLGPGSDPYVTVCDMSRAGRLSVHAVMRGDGVGAFTRFQSARLLAAAEQRLLDTDSGTTGAEADYSVYRAENGSLRAVGSLQKGAKPEDIPVKRKLPTHVARLVASTTGAVAPEVTIEQIIDSPVYRAAADHLEVTEAEKAVTRSDDFRTRLVDASHRCLPTTIQINEQLTVQHPGHPTVSNTTTAQNVTSHGGSSLHTTVSHNSMTAERGDCLQAVERVAVTAVRRAYNRATGRDSDVAIRNTGWVVDTYPGGGWSCRKVAICTCRSELYCFCKRGAHRNGRGGLFVLGTDTLTMTAICTWGTCSDRPNNRIELQPRTSAQLHMACVQLSSVSTAGVDVVGVATAEIAASLTGRVLGSTEEVSSLVSSLGNLVRLHVVSRIVNGRVRYIDKEYYPCDSLQQNSDPRCQTLKENIRAYLLRGAEFDRSALILKPSARHDSRATVVGLEAETTYHAAARLVYQGCFGVWMSESQADRLLSHGLPNVPFEFHRAEGFSCLASQGAPSILTRYPSPVLMVPLASPLSPKMHAVLSDLRHRDRFEMVRVLDPAVLPTVYGHRSPSRVVVITPWSHNQCPPAHCESAHCVSSAKFLEDAADTHHLETADRVVIWDADRMDCLIDVVQHILQRIESNAYTGNLCVCTGPHPQCRPFHLTDALQLYFPVRLESGHSLFGGDVSVHQQLMVDCRNALESLHPLTVELLTESEVHALPPTDWRHRAVVSHSCKRASVLSHYSDKWNTPRLTPWCRQWPGDTAKTTAIAMLLNEKTCHAEVASLMWAVMQPGREFKRVIVVLPDQQNGQQQNSYQQNGHIHPVRLGELFWSA